MLEKLEQALFNGGLLELVKHNSSLDDFLLTGDAKPRPHYKCCNEKIAEKMVELAKLNYRVSILEPSAGKGCILKRITKYPLHFYCELNGDFLKELSLISPNGIIGMDFLKLRHCFDRIIMNPPFKFNAYQAHILHGYRLLNDNGIMVCLFPTAALSMKNLNKNLLELFEKGTIIQAGNVCGENTNCSIFKVIKNEQKL